jgi:predicted RNase H-like HicB family nuclease
MANYIAFIRKDAESDYGVDFPDFPGCIAAGATLDEARAMAQEALELHVEGMIEDGEAIPEPSSLETVMAAPEHRGAVAMLVSVPDQKVRVVRVNITVPEDLLKAIDERATASGYTRSGYLAVLARRDLEERRSEMRTIRLTDLMPPEDVAADAFSTVLRKFSDQFWGMVPKTPPCGSDERAADEDHRTAPTLDRRGAGVKEKGRAKRPEVQGGKARRT